LHRLASVLGCELLARQLDRGCLETPLEARGVINASSAGARVRAASKQVASPRIATAPNERMPALADSNNDP
jgi:hypothetical protein